MSIPSPLRRPKSDCPTGPLLLASLGFAALLSPSLTLAQDSGAAAPAVSPWSANVTVASQYLARGIRQTWGGAALQAGLDYADPSGFIAGAWTSNVSHKFIDGGHLEVDLYAGYGWSAGDVNYSAALFYYLYPGARMAATGTRYNYSEAVLSANYKWLTLKYALTVTRDYFGFNSDTLLVGAGRHSRGSGYFDAGLNIPLDEQTALQLHYGWQRVNNFSHFNWQDVKVALSQNFEGGWNLTGGLTRAYNKHHVFDTYTTGTPNAQGQIFTSNPLKATAFVTLTKTF